MHSGDPKALYTAMFFDVGCIAIVQANKPTFLRSIIVHTKQRALEAASFTETGLGCEQPTQGGGDDHGMKVVIGEDDKGDISCFI